MAESRYGMTAAILAMLYNINRGSAEYLPPADFNPFTTPEQEPELNPECPPPIFFKMLKQQR